MKPSTVELIEQINDTPGTVAYFCISKCNGLYFAISRSQLQGIHDWCLVNLGTQSQDTWTRYDKKFTMHDTGLATLFVLRWQNAIIGGD